MYLAFTIFTAVALILPPALTQQTLAITVIQGEPDTCPSDQEREEALQNITAKVRSILQGFQSVLQCGEGVWRKVVFLNMSDPSQQCPSPWREYTSVRSCGRPVQHLGCESVTFDVNDFQYNKVCGRAIGYQYYSPDAFGRRSLPTNTPDDNYVDGLSVTYGANPRKHIWTFAAGPYEPRPGSRQTNTQNACPCAIPNDPRFGTTPPSYVGNNYFCEAGHFDPTWSRNHYSEPLWDGDGCVTSQCCSFNTPPWFSVQLPNSTADDIEVRICGDQHISDEDTTIELLEVYVQ